MPIDLLHELLYANYAVGKMRSQFLKCSPTGHLKRFSMLLFTTLVWLSVWGWKTVENLSLVPILCH